MKLTKENIDAMIMENIEQIQELGTDPYATDEQIDDAYSHVTIEEINVERNLNVRDEPAYWVNFWLEFGESDISDIPESKIYGGTFTYDRGGVENFKLNDWIPEKLYNKLLGVLSQYMEERMHDFESLKINGEKFKQIDEDIDVNEKQDKFPGEHRGQQYRETLEQAGYTFVENLGHGTVLLRDEDGKLEQWQKRDDFAGFVIVINGKGYEFVTSVNESKQSKPSLKINGEKFKQIVMEQINNSSKITIDGESFTKGEINNIIEQTVQEAKSIDSDLSKLKKEAMSSCTKRGHTMKGWKSGNDQNSAFTECKHCGATVHVTTKPAPNGIDIGGKAVAVNCKKEKTIKESGMKKWKARLHKVYTNLEEFENYCETYGLLERLGYDTAQEAWDDNPVITGSVYPEDFGVVGNDKPKQSEQLEEKWGTEAKIKKLNKFGKKERSMESLKKQISALRNKKSRTSAESHKLKQLNFAVRARSGFGKVNESNKITFNNINQMIQETIKKNLPSLLKECFIKECKNCTNLQECKDCSKKFCKTHLGKHKCKMSK